MNQKVLYNIDLLQNISMYLECYDIFREVCKTWIKIPSKCIYIKYNNFNFPKC